MLLSYIVYIFEGKNRDMIAKCLASVILIIVGLSTTLHASCTKEQEKSFGNLRISHGWLRAMLKGNNSSGYLRVQNLGSTDARLISVKADFAEKSTFHIMREEYGVMRMIPLMDGVIIPAESTVDFLPGALHIMFMKLNTQLLVNEIKKVVLSFETVGSTSISFCVKKITAKNYYSLDK